jgi:hypothetical protein
LANPEKNAGTKQKPKTLRDKKRPFASLYKRVSFTSSQIDVRLGKMKFVLTKSFAVSFRQMDKRPWSRQPYGRNQTALVKQK